MNATLTHNRDAEGPRRLEKSLTGWLVVVLLAVPLLATTRIMMTSGGRSEPVPFPSGPALPRTVATFNRIAPARAAAEGITPLGTSPADPVASSSDQPADAVVVGESLPAASYDRTNRERVLFLTIVGDRTYFHWGWAGDRPPRIDGLAHSDLASGWAPDPVDAAEDPAAMSAVTVAGNSDDYGGLDRPYGPAPLECPRTLPAGSTQATADTLHRESGCRYLSTCTEDDECTWYYQGRDLSGS